MKKMIVMIVMGLVLSMYSVSAQDSSRRALAEELLNVMNMRDTIENSFDMVKQMIPAQMEENIKQAAQATGEKTPSQEKINDITTAQQKMMDMVCQELSWDKMKDDYITLYAETFTEEEMKGIIAFYKTPAGVAFVKKQPELMKRSMELSQKIMMQIMPKILTMTKELKGADKKNK